MQNNIVLNQRRCMMNNLVCPISSEQINEYASRVTATLIVSLTLLFLLTQNIWFLVFVTFDFSFRIFKKVKYSPISWLVSKMFNIINLPKKLVNKAPKVFAARLGFFLSALSLVLFFFYPTTAIIIASILGICVFADAAFNFCIGCVIYHYIVFPFYKK